MRFARIVYFVRDAGKLADWYCATFGLQIRYDAREDEWVEVDAGDGVSIAFHTVESPELPTTEIAFAVDDIDRRREELIAAGIEMWDPQSWRHYRYCKGRDPEGHVFQIITRCP